MSGGDTGLQCLPVFSLPSCKVGLVDLGTLKITPEYQVECNISLCHRELLVSVFCESLLQSLELVPQLVETCVTYQILFCVDGSESET